MSREDYFKQAFYISSAAHVISVLATGEILDANDAFCRSVGYARAELIGCSPTELNLWASARDRKKIVQQLGAMGHVEGMEINVRSRSGEIRTLLTSIEPIQLGDLPCVIATGLDITDRKQAEEALYETQSTLNALIDTLEDRVRQRTAEAQALYDSAPTGYHSVDADGTVIMINQTELSWLGYSREEVIGRPAIDFLSPAARQTFAAEFAAFKERGFLRDYELELQRKDGSVFPVLLTSKAVYDEQGNFIMSRATAFNDTERKAVDDALRRANLEMERAVRMKDDFLATMSHELRTPLMGILTLNEVLQEQIYGPLTQRQVRALRSVDTNARHLLGLVNDLLDLSKIEAGKLELTIEQSSVDAICQSSLSFVRDLAHKKNILIQYTSNQPSAQLRADPKRVKQMLVNLLGNAIKFTPAGGQVELRVTVEDARRLIHFAVQDTGIGIAAEDLARLFQPFTQLDSALTRQHEGTGLGLTLVKRLARQHGGDVGVTSSGLNQGSCFTITLPYSGCD